MDEPLFPQTTAYLILDPGQKVQVQVVWGVETATVVRTKKVDGYPMVELKFESGEVVDINVGRVVQ